MPFLLGLDTMKFRSSLQFEPALKETNFKSGVSGNLCSLSHHGGKFIQSIHLNEQHGRCICCSAIARVHDCMQCRKPTSAWREQMRALKTPKRFGEELFLTQRFSLSSSDVTLRHNNEYISHIHTYVGPW